MGMEKKVYNAIGLMSGTSLDGIDAAFIRTDGFQVYDRPGFISIPYDDDLKARLRGCLEARRDEDGRIAAVERDYTLANADVVKMLMEQVGEKADVIGFHGQTLFHDPDDHFTWQIGDGNLLAKSVGVPVVNDFRQNDMKHGGQGAPFLPLYHCALANMAGLPRPMVFLNIGGVSNVTWLGSGTADASFDKDFAWDRNILAFDTGPGNAFIDDWMSVRTGKPYDADGHTAADGNIHNEVLQILLEYDYINVIPPKSCDRNDLLSFMPSCLIPFSELRGFEKGSKDKGHPDDTVGDMLSIPDGAATLTAFTVESIKAAQKYFAETPVLWAVCGGGRKNTYMMRLLDNAVEGTVKPIEACIDNVNGDAVEAEGFAYYAVRSLFDLPISFPSTTGCSKQVTGGKLHKAV